METKKLDLKGLPCPQPALKMTIEALSMKPGDITRGGRRLPHFRSRRPRLVPAKQEDAALVQDRRRRQTLPGEDLTSGFPARARKPREATCGKTEDSACTGHPRAEGARSRSSTCTRRFWRSTAISIWSFAPVCWTRSTRTSRPWTTAPSPSRFSMAPSGPAKTRRWRACCGESPDC